LGEQGLDFALAPLIRQRAIRARRGTQGALQDLLGLLVAVLVEQEVAVEVVRVDAVGVDGQGLLEVGLGLVFVAEAEGPARYLRVKSTEGAVD